MPCSFKFRYIPCPVRTCNRQFTNQAGLKNHIWMHCTPQAKANVNLPAHQPPMNDNNYLLGDDNDVLVDPEQQDLQILKISPKKRSLTICWLMVNWLISIPKKNWPLFRLALWCTREFFTWSAPPPPWEECANDDFATFNDAPAFELADLLFQRDQMSGTHINDLLQIWATTLPKNHNPPFGSKNEMYNSIDNLDLGGAPWICFTVKYNGKIK